MEMPTVGQRCALEECKQLDFLPFTCSHCRRVFCKDHYAPGRHSCASVEDRVADVEGAAPFVTYRCTFPLCLAQSPLEMPCPACVKHFCLEHRHHGCIDIPRSAREREREKWDAPRRLFEAAKAEADRQVGENLSRAVGKPGVGKTAARVRLMRLKGKAVGSEAVPTTDRVYFSVHLPLTSGRKSRAVFLGRRWTVGRAIDAVAQLCDVVNKNNRAGGEKLRLFRRSDGATLAAEMDRKLEDLLREESVVDGESLVLEYVADGSSERLDDVERYQD